VSRIWWAFVLALAAVLGAAAGNKIVEQAKDEGEKDCPECGGSGRLSSDAVDLQCGGKGKVKT